MSALSVNEVEQALDQEQEGDFEKLSHLQSKKAEKKQVKKQTRDFRNKRRNRHNVAA